VAKAEGLDVKINNNLINNYCSIKDEWEIKVYSPTTNPSQAWPIIERERISILFTHTDLIYAYFDTGSYDSDDSGFYGKESLEAAMRCFVSSKFGDEVDIDIDNLTNK
jgi:hypothetical protein